VSDSGRQLPLSLSTPGSRTREDFVVGTANAAAAALVDRWPDWPAQTALLVGPPGSGKSHLAAVWASRAGATVLDFATLAGTDPLALAEAGNVVIEDIDRSRSGDTALLHLLNAARQRGGYVLMTAGTGPHDWSTPVADLASRLRAATPVTIAEPDDELLAQVLVKLLADRQMAVDRTVVDFVLRRMERSLAAANAFVAALDEASLAGKRAPSRALAAEVLERLEAGDGRGDGT
jgi:chromosomal replication initiation ATPase DnaA